MSHNQNVQVCARRFLLQPHHYIVTSQKTQPSEKNSLHHFKKWDEHYFKKVLRVFCHQNCQTCFRSLQVKTPWLHRAFQNKYLFLAIQPEDSKRLGAMISTALVYLWCRTCPGPKTVSPTFARFGGAQNVQGDTLWPNHVGLKRPRNTNHLHFPPHGKMSYTSSETNRSLISLVLSAPTLNQKGISSSLWFKTSKWKSEDMHGINKAQQWHNGLSRSSWICLEELLHQ